MNAVRRLPGTPAAQLTTGALLAAAMLGAAVSRPDLLRVVVAGVLVVGVVGLTLRLPVGAVLGALVVWLVALGLVRRLLSLAAPADAFGDPLLVVAAGVWIVLTLLAIRRGALDRPDGLTLAVLALAGLFVLSILNPRQGGLMVGLAGAFQVVFPMTAFVVGRGLCTDRLLDRLLWLVVALGAVVAAYGLYQQYVGFPRWDQVWIDTLGYTALNVGGGIRSFSSLAAASDYAQFLGVALVACVVRLGRFRRSLVVVGAGGLIAVALWNSAVRSSVVLTIAAIAVVVAAARRWSIGRMALVVLVTLAAIPAAVGYLAPSGPSAKPSFGQHQIQGLTDPFGETSTLPGHLRANRRGFESAFTNPAGTGIGATQIAAGKFGGVTTSGESDVGRIPSAAGLPGLVAYLCILILGLGGAYRLAATRGDPVALAALGILMVTFTGWTNGGQYAVMFWPWLVLGWVSAARRRAEISAHMAPDRAGAVA